MGKPPISEFKIKADMVNEEILSELRRLGISGETRQEVTTFMEYKKPINDTPTHKVVMVDSEYAVLAKSEVYRDIFGQINIIWSYYWAGINDEGTYFIRPLANIKHEFATRIDKIIAWANRVDEGFTKRLQGDVLIKFVKKNRHEKDAAIEAIDLSQTQQQFRHQKTNPFFFRPQPENLVTRLRTISRTPDNLNIEVEGKIFRRVALNSVQLGNHKLFYEGLVYQANDGYFAIDAEYLVLKHHEHQIVEQKIPEGHYAILAPQQGRVFENVRQAYD